MEKLGETIRELRVERKLSQPQLAALLNVSNGIISGWENNLYEPKASNIKKICQIFAVSADYLLGLESEKIKFNKKA